MTQDTTAAGSGFEALQQIERTHLGTWARHTQEQRAAANPTGQKVFGWYEEVQDRLAAAEPTTRFATALNALAETYEVDATTFVTGDGAYCSTQAAGFLAEVGFGPEAIVEAIGSRLDEAGGISAYDFAAALGELTGDPDSAKPYAAAGQTSRDTSEVATTTDGADGASQPSTHLDDHLPTDHGTTEPVLDDVDEL